MVLSRDADVFEFAAVELDPWISKELLQEKTTQNMADGETVRLGRFVHIIAAIRLPAPSMFSTTIVGLPGMCLPIWRAIVREYRS